MPSLARPSIALAALLALCAGCLEPGPTPLGPELTGTPLPEDVVVVELDADAMGLAVETWELALPLFNTEMLFLGRDAASGFRAEPIWVFDTEDLAALAGGVDRAWLQLTFPEPDLEFPEDGDNPDAGRDIRARLWRLAAVPDLDDSLLVLPLEGAVRVPRFDDEVEDLEPFAPYEITGEGIVLPPALVQSWVDEGGEVALALEWAEDAGEEGMLRVHSRRTPRPDAETTTAAVLKAENSAGSRQSVQAGEDGLALDRAAAPGEADRLVMTSGRKRAAHLTFSLPDSLLDPDLMFVRALLTLEPDSSLLFGMSPDDRNDNLSGGLPSSEGGQTLRVTAADGAGEDALAGGTVQESAVPLFEENLVYSGPDSLPVLVSRSRIRTPLRIPLTRWLQNLVAGGGAGSGVSLVLNGAGDRPRRVGWILDDAEPTLRPRLEIVYLRRPDFG